jgi:5-methylcytosine-specific restriction endonuclease McrA
METPVRDVRNFPLAGGGVASARMNLEEATKHLAGGRVGQILRVFWSAFPWETCGKKHCCDFKRCVGGECKPPSKKRRLLRSAAAINLYENPQWNRNKVVREYFNQTGPYAEMSAKPCFLCGVAAHNHRHHIVQIQHGGHNAPRNIVLLCRECHRDIHQRS